MALRLPADEVNTGAGSPSTSCEAALVTKPKASLDEPWVNARLKAIEPQRGDSDQSERISLGIFSGRRFAALKLR